MGSHPPRWSASSSPPSSSSATVLFFCLMDVPRSTVQALQVGVSSSCPSRILAQCRNIVLRLHFKVHATTTVTTLSRSQRL
ncbi:hypothetical protein PF008_g13613 [Phytophthora fragariae]|uniref:Uncharacterized protein n=1 Tax=Phytophthora fragariae TaxID=53985 RepID=A0A6G0RJW8_9STRA|nr:hypothetical protein PF008_g13613 [Phytophthora fragariae]